jgi:branched-chain amino acid transport system substrate-binding protein
MNKSLGMLAIGGAAALVAIVSQTTAQSSTIRIGGIAVLEGPFTVLGQDSYRGMDLALAEFGGSIGGKKIEVIKESSNTEPDVAVAKARKLIEQDKVDVIVGPLSGSEGIAMRDYAKTVPNKTIVNGVSAAQETTLESPAANFFRFTTDGVQWMAGVGTYAFKNKGYKKVVTIAEDYSFPYSQVAGFMTEFCKLGGHVPDKFWVPIGTKDFSSVIAKIPSDVDAVYVALGGSDAVNFLTQYSQAGGEAKLIGGSIALDQSVLSAKGKFQKQVLGAFTAGPIADNSDSASWKKFVAAYKKRFPDGFGSPSLFAHGYYVSTKAVLTALKKVGGDVSGDQSKLRAALSSLSLSTPTGVVKLDANRQAIADIYLTEVSQAADGSYFNKLVKTTRAVNQTLGQPVAEFTKGGAPSRDNPSCP